MGPLWIVAAVLAVIVIAAYLWFGAQGLPGGEKLRRIVEQFEPRREELAGELLRAASATGKPRGLRWKSCELVGSPLFARDPKSRRLYALNGVTISFEAIEGGAMEDVEAVGNLRSASAVFMYRDSAWTTDGRVIFNLEPAEALQRFGSALVPLDLTDSAP